MTGWRRGCRRGAVLALAAAAALGAGGCSRSIGGTPVASPGAQLLSTRCKDYIRMSEVGRAQVIAAIGDDGNKLVAANPNLWVGLAAALCTFTDPQTRVIDVVAGGIR